MNNDKLAMEHQYLFCPEKPGPLGQVRVLRLDPIIQYSIIPTLQLFELKFIPHPYGVKPKPGPLAPDFYFF